jgi:hypothetical protein
VVLLGASMAKVEAEAEVEEMEEPGGGGEAALLEAATIAVEVVSLVVALVDVAGIDSVSGRRASQQFTLLSSRRKRTEWSRGSRLSETTHLNSLSVRLFDLIQTPIFTVSFEGPGWGTLGEPGVVRANFFPIRLPNDPIYDYTVMITPDTGMRRIRERIFQLLERHPRISPHARFIAHDKSQRLVSARGLEQPLEVTIDHTAEGAPPTTARPYRVQITLRGILDPQNLTR